MRGLVAAIGVILGLTSHPAAAEGPVLVELFTSQGCSSCPPADAMVVDLAARDDVIALAFHVDYWDYIGWTDIFGSPKNTARQQAYARAAGARTIYTPQFIVGGLDHVIGAQGMELADAIATHRDAATGVTLQTQLAGDTVSIEADAEAVGPMTVQLIRYSEAENVDILRGENAGRSITYVNTVMSWDTIAEWDGASPLALTAQIDGDFPSVVIVQAAGAGAVLAVAEVR